MFLPSPEASGHMTEAVLSVKHKWQDLNEETTGLKCSLLQKGLRHKNKQNKTKYELNLMDFPVFV